MRNKINLSDTSCMIIGNYILPHRSIFEFQKALHVTTELIELLEKHGDCPSIVTDTGDSESIYLRSVTKKLANISLKEHTYHVTLNLIKAAMKRYKDYDVHIPGAIITALAHDIGKIPDLRATACNTEDHTIISARKIRGMLAGNNQSLSDMVQRAVENHHSQSKDNFTQMLKQADRKARQMELMKLLQNKRFAPIDYWLSIEDFYKRIELYMNFSKGPDNWNAFSFNGIIYCKPQFILKIAKALCEELNIVDLTFIDESAREEGLRNLVQYLREHDLIHDHLRTDRYTRQYVIRTCIDRKHKEVLTPLKPVGFYNMEEIEKRKIGFTEIISGIRPV